VRAYIRRNIANIPKRRAIALAILIAASSGFSAWMAAFYATAPAGYAADYAEGGALLFSGIFVLVGLVFVVPPKTRWVGVASVLAALWLFSSFLLAANLLYRFNFVSWKDEREVALLPEVGKGLYIYFRPGTSEEAIEVFSSTILHQPRTDKGQDLLPGLSSYARLASSRNREIVAIGLRSGLTRAERRDLLLRVESQGVVSEVADHLMPQK
jgi:hypothetical protein